MSDSDLPQENLNPEETVEEVVEEAVPQRSASAVPPRRRASMFDDPMVRIMTGIAITMVALFLSGIVGALIFGLIGGNQAPRTAVERRLDELEGLIISNPRDPDLYSKYIRVLTEAGRYGEAQSTIKKALKAVDQSAGADITLAQARLYLAKKDYKAALATLDETQKIIKKNYDEEMKSDKLPNPSKSFGINKNYGEAALVRARILIIQKKLDEALKQYDAFLSQNPMASDVLIERADLKVKLGDKSGATADYKEALRYDPTNEAALSGLEKIGEAQ